MRSLALETSTRDASLALFEGSDLVAEFDLPGEQRTAESLIPACRRELAELGWKPADLNLLSVSIGPGSFTGLRIGVTTAKTLAYAIGADLIAIETMQVHAAQTNHASTVITLSDAQRRQLYVQPFLRQSGNWVAQGDIEVVNVDAFLRRPWNDELLAGPGLSRIGTQLPADVKVSESASWRPLASTVGRLAIEAHAQGQRSDFWTLKPLYIRASAAEEKRASAAETEPQEKRSTK